MSNNILIVEDDQSLATIFEASLKREGYNVIVTNTCADGISALNINEIDLVVLDMNLPDAPGTEVLDFIESEPALMSVVTVVLTGFTRFVNQASRPSVLQTLNKPVTGTMLVRAVKTALAGSL